MEKGEKEHSIERKQHMQRSKRDGLLWELQVWKAGVLCTRVGTVNSHLVIPYAKDYHSRHLMSDFKPRSTTLLFDILSWQLGHIVAPLWGHVLSSLRHSASMKQTLEALMQFNWYPWRPGATTIHFLFLSQRSAVIMTLSFLEWWSSCPDSWEIDTKIIC